MKGETVMDFLKIIEDSTQETVKNMLNRKSNDKLDENLQNSIKENQILLDYSNNLLRSYHEELKKELAKQGIQIQ